MARHSVAAMIQDPRGKGGTATVVTWYRAWMDRHRLGERQEIILDEQATAWRPSVVDTDADVVYVPRVMPRFHVTAPVAARLSLHEVGLRAREIHVIGASCAHGWALAGAARSVVWLATTMADERRAKARAVDPARRALYRATLPTLQRMERAVLASADRVLAMSPHTADVLIADGVERARVSVVPVPVDTKAFHPGGDERRGLAFVGRAHDGRKGFDRLVSLVRASASVRDRGVVVVSPGAPEIVPSDVRPFLTWAGLVDNLAPVYQRAEILVLPSRQEGLGIVAFEALACATPVVARRCGGPDALLAQSGGGVVADDERAFQREVELLLTDPAARLQRGCMGRNWVERHLSAATFLERDAVFVP